MGYDVSDSSGTDDDIPPSHQDRVPRGTQVAGNGRSAVGSMPYSRMHIDMEAQIHHLEQEAYSAVLRAFKAQADAITWDKETLITELRKELRVSDDEHRELLSKVNADDVIHRIREWREDGMHQAAIRSTSHDLAPSSVLASRKKQKTSHSVPSLAYNVTSLALHPPSIAPSMKPSSSGAGSGAGGKKPKPGHLIPGLSTMNSMQYPATSRSQFNNHGFSGGFAANEVATSDPYIGRKVWTRWPDDNDFYEAVITDYNAAEGRHALVYDIYTANETWEWVDLKDISPDDIRWDDNNLTTSHRGGHIGQGRGIRKSMTRGGIYPRGGRGRGSAKGQSRKELPLQNGIGQIASSDDIQLLNTETLVKEVERVCSTNHPDPIDLQKAKKMLKDHERALVDAITRLADASDGESDGDQQPFSHEQSMDHD